MAWLENFGEKPIVFYRPGSSPSEGSSSVDAWTFGRRTSMSVAWDQLLCKEVARSDEILRIDT